MIQNLLMERKYFRLFFIFYMFTNTLALGYFGIVNNPLSYVVILWASLLLLYDLFTKQIAYKTHTILIVIYGLLLLLATINNKAYSDLNSYIMAIIQIIIFLFIFANPKHTTLQTMKQELRMIIPFTSILTCFASFISLCMYVTNFYRTQNGWYLGLVGNRLFGVYFNCNPASFLSIIVILMSLYAIKNKYKGKLFYYVNITIQLLYVILTQCRAAIIILSIIIVALIYYRLFRAKETNKFKKAIISSTLCILVLFGSHIVQQTLSIIPKMQGAQMEDDSRFQFDKLYEIYTLLKSGHASDIKKIVILMDDVSSGRIKLIDTSIKIWQSQPLRGIGAYNYRKMYLNVDSSYTDSTVGKQLLHSHNVFLESLVSAGIFGFIIFFIFFFKSCLLIRDILKKYQNKTSYFIILLFTMIVVSEFIGGLFDFGVFYNYSLSTTLAWLFLGYLYFLNEHPDYELINTSKDFEFMKYELEIIDYHKESNFDIHKLNTHILKREIIDNHYYITIAYSSTLSSFVYRLDYELLNDHLDDTILRSYDTVITKELFQMIKDDIANIMSN